MDCGALTATATGARLDSDENKARQCLSHDSGCHEQDKIMHRHGRNVSGDARHGLGSPVVIARTKVAAVAVAVSSQKAGPNPNS